MLRSHIPQPVIRSPYAAPFEFLILHRVGLAILGRPSRPTLVGNHPMSRLRTLAN
jgi:hypothetical protein